MSEGRAELGRRERNKLAIHERILEAAFALFEEQGFHLTRVSEIAERADVAEKTLFNHFPSKQHLLREIAEQALERFLADIEELRKLPLSTRDRVQRLFEDIADRADEAGPMRPELLHEMIHVAHGSGELEHEQARLLHDAFDGLVRDGVAAGDVNSGHDPRTLAEVLMGAFYALMFNFANFRDYPLRQQAVATAHFLGESMSAKPPEKAE